jgi:hypothetical protein
MSLLTLLVVIELPVVVIVVVMFTLFIYTMYLAWENHYHLKILPKLSSPCIPSSGRSLIHNST